VVQTVELLDQLLGFGMIYVNYNSDTPTQDSIHHHSARGLVEGYGQYETQHLEAIGAFDNTRNDCVPVQ
jgi:hypothetical protein